MSVKRQKVSGRLNFWLQKINRLTGNKFGEFSKNITQAHRTGKQERKEVKNLAPN